MLRNEIVEALEALKERIAQNIIEQGKNATGKTIASMYVEVDGEHYRLIGRPYFAALQTGRQPTPPGTPPSVPTLQQAILEWVEAKGLANGNEAVSLSWAISKSIHQKGTKLWQRGGGDDVYSSAIDETLLSLRQLLEKNLIEEIENINWEV